MKKDQVYHTVLNLARLIARERLDGALFVIASKKKLKNSYRLLYPPLIAGHYVNEKGIGAVILKLANLDGAFIVSEQGELIAYGAMIKKVKAMPGFGTKHAAAAGVTQSIPKSTAVLVPEKIDWIKIFQEGRVILEMDSEERPDSIRSQVISFLTDHDTALITAAGASAAIVGLPAVLVISGTYLAVKTAGGIIKKNLENLK